MRASRANVQATEAHKINACGINSGHVSSKMYIDFLAPSVESTPEEALNTFNFMGVTDRFDEYVK